MEKILAEAIKLETNVATLYTIFQKVFPRDAGFWWRLALEEQNHAALLKSGRDHFLPLGNFPHEIVPATVESLVAANEVLEGLIEQCRTDPPPREGAFNTALELELSAGEIHFQKAMECQTPAPALRIFQKLSADDQDHVGKLLNYMTAEAINLLPELRERLPHVRGME